LKKNKKQKTKTKQKQKTGMPFFHFRPQKLACHFSVCKNPEITGNDSRKEKKKRNK